MLKRLIYIAALFLFFVSCNSGDPKANEAKNQKDEPSKIIWTNQEKASATQHCIVSGNEKDFCDCSVSVLVEIVSYDEFNQWNAKVLSGQQPSGDIVSKMMSMSRRVLAECVAK